MTELARQLESELTKLRTAIQQRVAKAQVHSAEELRVAPKPRYEIESPTGDTSPGLSPEPHKAPEPPKSRPAKPVETAISETAPSPKVPKTVIGKVFVFLTRPLVLLWKRMRRKGNTRGGNT